MNNLLNQALSVVPTQKVGWRRFRDYMTDARGQEKATYHLPRFVRGQVQPAGKTEYERHTVYATRALYSVWLSLPVKNARKLASGDLILWDNKTLEVIAVDDWHTQSGWAQATAVEAEQ